MHSDGHEYMRGSGCSRCGSLSLCGQWLQSFSVAICNSCRQDEELVTKARAFASDYRLEANQWR